MTEAPGSFFNRLKSRLPRKPWQLALVATFGVVSVAVVVLAVVAATLLPTLPPIHELSDPQLKVPLRVYTADGQLIAEFGEEKRIPVKIEAVPDQLIQAILAAEDHSFFQHHGVDFVGIARAAYHNFRTNSAGQGASTITMQVARNYFLTPEKTLGRKFKEMLLAFKIERELTKQEILELYINKIFLGHRSYGFAAAAQIYFGSNLDKLTLPEMAMLAGLPKAPSRDNPLTNPTSAVERRNYVLRHMHELGYIDAAMLDKALAAPLTASKHALKFDMEAPYVGEMVRQYMYQTYDEKTYAEGFHVYTTIDSKHQRAANAALRRGILEYDRRHGYRGAAGHITLDDDTDESKLDDVLKDYRALGELVPGVVTQVEDRTAVVYTQDGTNVTLEWEGIAWARPYIDENVVGPAPAAAIDVLRPGNVVYVEPVASSAATLEQPGTWRLSQSPNVAGAVVSMRARDGALLALAGGFDFYQSSFNRVTQAERQPGSSLKPFIFTAALEKGFTPASTISGAPIVIDDAVLEDEWRPENYSKKFFGPTRLRQALALSLNLVAVRLLRAIGPAYTAEYMARFGFDPRTLPRNLSLALGTASATPLQMARAFAVYANGGYAVEPYFITRVEDAHGKVLEQANPPVACLECGATEPAARAVATAQSSAPAAPRVLTPEISFLMTSMLQDVIRDGTGSAAKVLGRRDLAGKTGTTNEYRDAWFSGFNSDVVATAWLGFDQPASLGRGETGGRAALPIWIDYMRVALAGMPERPLVPPPGIAKVYVNADTGQLTSAGDPLATEEFLIKGTDAPPVIAGDAPEPQDAAAAAPPPPPADNIRDQLF